MYLLVRRQWWAIIYTTIAGIALALISLYSLNINIPNDSMLDLRLKVFIMAIPQFVMVALALIGLKQTEQSTKSIEASSPNVGRLIMSENG